MISLGLGNINCNDPLRILCLGAHCDDIEIGCGATLLKWIRDKKDLQITWVVFCSDPKREAETRQSAEMFLRGCAQSHLIFHQFRDGFLPDAWAMVKEEFEKLKALPKPDIIFTHRQSGEAHQDHRTVSELTWNTFRDHFILMYEIPKFEGDLGRPNAFVPVSEEDARNKAEYLQLAYPTQATKKWFSRELFLGLMSVRSVECGSPTPYAEGFHADKIILR